MRRFKAFLGASSFGCLLLASLTIARAEEIEHKWRLGFSVGGYSISDQVHSSSANVRVLLRTNGEIDSFLQDPRNDSGAFSNFGLEPQYGTVLSASYGINRFWFVEGSVGYRRGTVGNVMVQAMFDGVPTTAEQPNNYAIYNLDGGTLTQIPVQITAGIRFRPKSTFNPYLAAGVGYAFNSYQPSAEVNDLSRNLDSSIGGFARLSGRVLDPADPSTYTNLSGITVDAPDAPEWHFGGGLEWRVAPGWTLFLDGRYTVYSGKFSMGVNGSNELGISVPNDQRVITDADALGPFGGYQIVQGGLIDGGSYVPRPGYAGTNCDVNRANCEFAGPPDGVLDTGYYYVQAGSVRYDVASYQFGFKFTF